MDNIVEKIVHEVKSQGVFDEFRKDSMSDVDTKPAYQNLRQRVDTSVKKFLSGVLWTPDLNKNQLREKLRRHITESGFLDVGVERIVDQVVNPKIGSVFQPRIEEIAYKYLGLPPPQKIYDPPPPPLMHPLTAPPLPLTAPPPPLKVETCSLLPNDLEQVSPDSDKATMKSEIDGEDKTEVDMEMDEKLVDDDESPPFEPLLKMDADAEVKSEVCKLKTEAKDSSPEQNYKKEDDNSNGTVMTEAKDGNDRQNSNNYVSVHMDKDASQSMDCRNSQDSQYSSVSSDTRLSPVIKDNLQRSSQEDAVTANISEEAQMPKFNESSSEPNGINSEKCKDMELHFDIKKDEIKFEGTERKPLANSQECAVSEDNKCALSTKSLEDTKGDNFKFNNNSSNLVQREDDGECTPNAQELSFGSSIEDSTSTPTSTTKHVVVVDKIKEFSAEEKSPQLSTPKHPSTPTHTITPTATPTPPFSQSSAATPSPVSTQRNDRDHSKRYSSSSKHKKHSKERRRSHDREKERDHYRNKDSKHGSSGKHSSSSSSKHSVSSSQNKSTSERESGKLYTSHSSSKYTKHSSYSSGEKRHSSSSSHRDHSSSSSTSKRKDDDHQEAKQKLYRRKSTDSNDDDGDRADSSGKYGSQNYKSSNTSSKSKSSNNTVENASSKSNDLQKGQEESTNNSTNERKQHNVVILNNLLVNPQTQCVDLCAEGLLIGMTLPSTSAFLDKCDEDNCSDLLYFENMQKLFEDKLNFLNRTMDLCRSAVNSLHFNSPIDEGIELLSSEDDYNHNRNCSSTLKRKSSICCDNYEKTPQKRCSINKGEDVELNTSPTPSDISISSKENEEIDKNTGMDQDLNIERSSFVSCHS
ncbi:biorientation Defective 1 isoform X2 [Haematobia irritans]|uniref:biorientation Defective 1 isoform X2 n=1 Tax=Haematobia irritans TaxID=7368 RepID=UPI003F4FE2CE